MKAGKPLMQMKTIASVAGLLISTSLAFATDVQAAPTYGAGYPRFKYEGLYPEQTVCGANSFRLKYSDSVLWNGQGILVEYFYSSGCGSYARINNAPIGCAAFLDRSIYPNNPNVWEFVAESVDPGIDYAYTKVGNNLDGRLSRAALVCNSVIVYRGRWY